MKRKLSAVLPPNAFKDKVVVPFSKAHFDAGTVLRPAAMLADRRSGVWVTLDPVGVVMRERDDSRTQGVDNALCLPKTLSTRWLPVSSVAAREIG